jgi:hypothetical protein
LTLVRIRERLLRVVEAAEACSDAANMRGFGARADTLIVAALTDISEARNAGEVILELTACGELPEMIAVVPLVALVSLAVRRCAALARACRALQEARAPHATQQLCLLDRRRQR